MRVGLVHTPMSYLETEGRASFWRNFDRRYHAMHPNARHMKKYLWELPHWMTWLGAVLEREGFVSQIVLDFYTDCGELNGIKEDLILDILLEKSADVYLFSPMTPNLHHAIRIAEMIKEIDRTRIIIFGGVVATPLHIEIASNPAIDYVVRGEGEYALPALLKALRNQDDLTSIGNLTFRNHDGSIIVNNAVFPKLNLNNLPFPKIDLFPKTTGENIRYIRQVHTYGCPYSCPFCSDLVIGMKPRNFAVDRTLAEIRAHKEYFGLHHHIYFGDETFTLYTERTLALCDALRAEGSIEYDCQTRIDCLQDPRLPRALATSGCRWLEIGLESANQSTLDLVKQRAKVGSLEHTLNRLRDEGIAACANLIIGLPSESPSDMRRSVDVVCTLISQGLLHAAYVYQFVPYPGSTMYQDPARFGIAIHHYDYSLYNEELLPVFSSANASADTVYGIFIEAVANVSEAMSAKPYLGVLPEDGPNFGGFWQEAHP